jgi:hypothetical protein
MAAAGAECAKAQSVTAVVIVCNDWFGSVFLLSWSDSAEIYTILRYSIGFQY